MNNTETKENTEMIKLTLDEIELIKGFRKCTPVAQEMIKSLIEVGKKEA